MACVRGHHKYKDIEAAVTREILVCSPALQKSERTDVSINELLTNHQICNNFTLHTRPLVYMIGELIHSKLNMLAVNY